MSRHAATGLDQGHLIVGSHDGVVSAAGDPETFSSAVSRHLQVPNGLDGEAHAQARRLLDPFFEPAEVDALEPALQRIAEDLLDELADRTFDAVADLGARYAVRAQSAWLGWDPAIEDELLQWVVDSRAATRTGDGEQTARVAARFDRIVARLLDERRERRTGDVTTRLMLSRFDDGRRLTEPEVVSVLRNWTGGDLSSLALCAGVILHWLATHPEQQATLAGASDAGLDAAIDEILRIDDPFVSNRRIATRATMVDGCPVRAGDVVVLDWRAANRDPAVFAGPDDFRPQQNAAANLVYGTGPHVCPGRPLATRELRVLTRELLAHGRVVFEESAAPERELPPVAGFRTVPVYLQGIERPR